MSPKTRPPAERFWPKVDVRGPDECWLWKGGAGNYGVFWSGTGSVGAHCASWTMANGEIPIGMYVLHSCDNGHCVNPAHLFLGTHIQNMADMRAKNRQASGDRNASRAQPHKLRRGEAHGNSVLTDKQRADIRANYLLCRVAKRELARRYGVSQQVIQYTLKGIRK